MYNIIMMGIVIDTYDNESTACGVAKAISKQDKVVFSVFVEHNGTPIAVFLHGKQL